MGPLDAFWHLTNFLAPAIGLGAISSLLAKLIWRRALATAVWRRLLVCSVSASTLALVVGLIVFGHDGAMATYALMVSACAVAIWWVGLRRAA